MNRYDELMKVLHWCRKTGNREFLYHDVDVRSQTLKGLCNTKFHGKIWIEAVGRVKSRDSNNKLWRYRLADHVDVGET